MNREEYRFAENEIRESSERIHRERNRKKKAGTAKAVATVMAFAVAFGAVSGGVSTGIQALRDSHQLVLTSELDSVANEPVSEYSADKAPDREPAGILTDTAEGTENGSTALPAPQEDGKGAAEAQAQTEGDSTLTTEEVAARGLSSVVAITNISVQEVEDIFGSDGEFDLFDLFGGFGSGYGIFNGAGGSGSQRDSAQTYESTSMGTGILIDKSSELLYISTNAHVVEDATTLTAAFADGSAAEAQLVGYDEANDLAVIAVRIADLSEETLGAVSIIPVGSSDSLKLGEEVVAIGNALGYGQSVSKGIVSALDRTMEGGEGVYGEGLIQTDAAINPGNSGGALLNMRGELVGINSAKYASTEVEGMGYAIPISYAWPILSQMISGSTGA